MFEPEHDRLSGMIYYLPAVAGPYGAGVMGDDRMKAILRWAHKAGMQVVQFTPHGPTTISNSPYQSASAFAGNPYLVNPQRLLEEGLITQEVHDRAFCLPDSDRVPYGLLFQTRMAALRQAFDTFVTTGGLTGSAYLRFCRENRAWLEDYALYAAIKETQGHRPFYDWPVPLRRREPAALTAFAREHSLDLAFQRFVQFCFWRDVEETARFARELGISLYADLPFYVSVDSADVWAYPELFQCAFDAQDTFRILQESGTGADRFRDSLRSWGNPTYNWETHSKTRYAWFRRRVALIGRYFSGMRFDHVVGLYSYLGITRDENGALTGKLCPGGEAYDPPVTRVLQKEAEKWGLTVIGEDVGHMQNENRTHMMSLGWYGMRMLQFAFSERNRADNMHLPFHYGPRHTACLGNHDNPSCLHFLRHCPEASRQALELWTRETEPQRIFRRLILTLYASPAGQIYLSMPDLAQVEEGPYHDGWDWKLPPEALTQPLAERLARLAVYSGRIDGSREDYRAAVTELMKEAG